MEFSVSVGNVGTLRYDNLEAAERTFADYRDVCLAGSSRAEFPVVLFGDDGEILREDYGPCTESGGELLVRVFPTADVDYSDAEETFATVPMLGDFRLYCGDGRFEAEFRPKGSEIWQQFSGGSLKGALNQALVVIRSDLNGARALVSDAITAL